MRVIHRPLDFLLRSGLFVAGCAVALAWETTLLARVPARPVTFYAFVFFATWASYRLHAIVGRLRALARYEWQTRVTHRASAVSGDGVAASKRPPLDWDDLLSSGLAFLGTAILLPFGTHRADLPAIVVASLLATFYCVPIHPRGPALREFGLLKIAVLAGTWTLVTGYLPGMGADVATLLYLCVRRFAFMFALCLAFDVRDVADDARGGVRTVPVLLGTSASYALMRWTLMAFATLVLVGPLLVNEPFARSTTIALLVSAGLTWLAIESTRRPATTHRFYLGCIDGMMLVQCLLVVAVTRVR